MHAKAILRISILILCTSPVVSNGQITITKDHMPKVDDNIEFSDASPIGVDVSKTGANHKWDYTKLTKISDGTDEFKASYKTPYLLNFGFTAIGKKLQDTLGFSSFQLKNIYNFYRNDSKSFRDVGIGFQFAALPLPQSGKHTDPDELFIFPLTYGNKDTSTFDVEVPISAGIKLGSFFRSGTRYTEVDGWGTISTPYLKDVACIRVKSRIVEYDSIKVSTPSINFGQEVVRVEYTWLSTSERIPVLQITGNEVLGNFTPSRVTYRNEWSQAPIVVADFSTDKTVVTPGTVLKFTNKSTGDNLTYNWSVSPSQDVKFVNGTDATSIDPVMVITANGNYSVQLIATSESVSDTMLKSGYITVDDKMQIVLPQREKLLFPNPASTEIHLTNFNIKEGSVRLYNANGSQVDVSFASQVSNVLDVSQLKAGTYLLRWKGSDDIEYWTKVMVAR